MRTARGVIFRMKFWQLVTVWKFKMPSRFKKNVLLLVVLYDRPIIIAKLSAYGDAIFIAQRQTHRTFLGRYALRECVHAQQFLKSYSSATVNFLIQISHKTIITTALNIIFPSKDLLQGIQSNCMNIPETIKNTASVK